MWPWGYQADFIQNPDHWQPNLFLTYSGFQIPLYWEIERSVFRPLLYAQTFLGTDEFWITDLSSIQKGKSVSFCWMVCYSDHHLNTGLNCQLIKKVRLITTQEQFQDESVWCPFFGSPFKQEDRKKIILKNQGLVCVFFRYPIHQKYVKARLVFDTYEKFSWFWHRHTSYTKCLDFFPNKNFVVWRHLVCSMKDKALFGGLLFLIRWPNIFTCLQFSMILLFNSLASWIFNVLFWWKLFLKVFIYTTISR